MDLRAVTKVSPGNRLFVVILCFHIHSGFVPSILRGAARLATMDKPQTAESAVCATGVSDFLYSSFVFIDIPALFLQFCDAKLWAARRRVTRLPRPLA